jgi:glycosyltransferase involved in cell wall biosynthesis
MNRLKIAYVTTYDASDVHRWSGLGYFIAKAIENSLGSLDFIGNLETKRFFEYELKRIGGKLLFNKRYETNIAPRVAKHYAKQIEQRLNGKDYDLIFCPGTVPISMIKTNIPIVTWTDACQPGLLDFYDSKDKLTEESFRHGVEIEKLALNNSALAVFSSEWAASFALNYHKVNPSKVKVVPFGANVTHNNTVDAIERFIANRDKGICKLLFVGVDWIRKGGDVALNTAIELNRKGLKTELSIVGVEPKVDKPLPEYVKSLGFISKSTKEGTEYLNKLFEESHFLIVPSQAEAYGLVFCESNSFGVPALATDVGGIPTIIKNDINGRTFSKDAAVVEYVNYISDLMSDYDKYEKLALSSFNEYTIRLNWDTAGQSVNLLVSQILDQKN